MMTVEELTAAIEQRQMKPEDEVHFVVSAASPTATWLPADVLEYMPDWTEEQAKQWLDLNRVANTIQAAMIGAGRETLENLLELETGKLMTRRE